MLREESMQHGPNVVLPTIHLLLARLLIKHFGLTFPETVGLVLAIEVLPNTAYWFCAAAEALLGTKASKLDPCHRGFAFGYLMAKLLLKHQPRNPNKRAGIQLNIYWEPKLPSGKDWEGRCALKTLACLRFHASFAKLVHKKWRAMQYKKL